MPTFFEEKDMLVALLIIGFIEMVVFLFLASSYHSLPTREQLLVAPGLAASVITMFLMITNGYGYGAVINIIACGCVLASLAYVRRHRNKAVPPTEQVPSQQKGSAR